MFDPKVKASNKVVLESLASSDQDIQKEAAGKINDYLVIKAREDGIFRKILPITPVTWDDCVPQVDSLKPVIIREMQPNSPGGYSLPFGGQPFNSYIGAPRYRIEFDRIKSRRLTADVINLRGYTMDIRQVFNDLLLKDILAEEDRKFIGVADAIVGTLDAASGARYNLVGAKGYISLGGPISRSTLALFAEGLPSTNRHLEPAVALVNNVTVKQLIALDRAAIGGDMAQDILIKGFSESTLCGLKWITTIKTDLVPNDVAYQFTAPESLGDFMALEDISVSTKVENQYFSTFAQEVVGGSLQNCGALCKATFSGSTAGSW